MTPRLTLALAPLALALGSTAAHAAPEPVEASVAIQDLDLSNSADRARLDTRIRSEARSICRSGLLGVAARAAEARCIEAALASAQPQVVAAAARAGAPVRIAIVRSGSDA